MDWITIAMFLLVAKPVFIVMVGFLLLNKPATRKVHKLLTSDPALKQLESSWTRSPNPHLLGQDDSAL